MLRRSASRRIDGKRGDVMLGSLRAVAHCCCSQHTDSVAMYAILHGCRRGDRLTLDQPSAGDINVAMGEIGAHVRLARPFGAPAAG